MKSKVLIVCVVGALILYFGYSILPIKYRMYLGMVNAVNLGGKVFTVEVANTDSLREKGLSGHEPLTDTEAMLFVFPTSGRYGFWMKDVTFPIDIIWIDAQGIIVHMERSVATSTYPNIFYPTSDSTYVLEIQSGQSESLRLKNGDVVEMYF